MIKTNYEAIQRGEEIRANLIALKEELKEEKNVRVLAYLLGGDFSVLTGLLKHEDPKVRKNAALLLGKMESEDLLPVLFDAYQKENTKFIRADYLKAISGMEYEELLPELVRRLEELRGSEIAQEDQKHVSEEIRMLQSMIGKYQKAETHRFTGYHRKEDIILTTNREQTDATASQLPSGSYVRLKGGLRVKGIEIGELLPIRTVSEFLFPIQTGVLKADRPEEIGTIAAAVMTEKMSALHDGKPPYRFRIELKGKMELAKKGSFIRNIAQSVEQASGGNWINSTDDYEAELRLLERRDGTFQPLMKFYTIPDSRFRYRSEFLASSIQPVNAALTAQLAKPYLKEGAQILDPFCGVGTMLIERAKAVPAGTMYGLDIYGDAVEKARVNTAHSGCRVNYIQRDFFTFTHEYLFDEIITDLPQITKMKSGQEIRALYHQFFRKAKEHLKEDGVMILYMTEPQFAAEAIRREPLWKVEGSWVINEKNHTSVWVVVPRHTK